MTSISKTLSVGFMMIALGAVETSAQTCAGAASFSAGAAQVGGAASFAKNTNAIGGYFGLGMPTGPFAIGAVSRLTIDTDGGGNETAPMLALSGGYGINVGSQPNSSTLQICPRVGFTYLGGPDIDLGPGEGTAEIRSTSYGAGFSIGGVATETATLSLVPAASLMYIAEKATVKAPGFDDEDISDSYGVFSGGVGLVFNRTVTIGGSVDIPLGLEDASNSFTLSFSINFGRRSP
jgi:hypothetical protein